MLVHEWWGLNDQIKSVAAVVEDGGKARAEVSMRPRPPIRSPRGSRSRSSRAQTRSRARRPKAWRIAKAATQAATAATIQLPAGASNDGAASK